MTSLGADGLLMAVANDFYVYEHWRPDTDQCFYVGKGRRARAHIMSARGIHHKHIQGKLAQMGLSVEVRIILRDLSEKDALDIELERIDFWKQAGIKLANKRSRMSWMSEEGKKRCGDVWRGKVGPRMGQTHTKEVRAKLAKLGRENIERFDKYRHLGPKSFARPVLCLDDGAEFESASAAARHYGVARSALIELCLGKNYRQTVGGMRFKYITDRAA